VGPFQELVEELVASTKQEPGTLIYEYFLSADETVLHIYERYSDSAAAVAHLKTFGEKFAGRFLELATPTRFSVYGEPSEEAKAVLDGFGATYLGTFAGFAR
jgi:quinol monooxygenase YgiN